MIRKILDRTSLYFCSDCGDLVSCTRKKRRHPGRVCKMDKCVDYAKCRIRSIYTVGKVKGMLTHPTTRNNFFKKYSVYYVLCGDCRKMESIFGVKNKSDKLTI